MTETYSDRNILLCRMGFTSYTAYLASPLWDSIRVLVLSAHGSVCKLCRIRPKRPAKVIHHLSYSQATLDGIDLSQLVPLCHSCHKQVEFNLRGEKRTLADAQREFTMMMEVECKVVVLHKKKNKGKKSSIRKSRTRKQRRRLAIEQMGGTGSGSIANYQRVLKEYEMRVNH